MPHYYKENFQPSANVKHLRTMHLHNALKCYEKLIELEPQQGDHYYDLGCTYAYLTRISSDEQYRTKCLDAIRKAIKISPTCSRYWNAYGCNVTDALTRQHCFIRGLQCDRNYIGWNCAGLLYLSSKEWELARGCFLQSQSLNPNSNSLAWIGLGVINEQFGHEGIVNARGNFKHAVSLKPSSAEANLGLGYTSYVLQDSREAITPLQKTLQYDDDQYAWNIYGLCQEECNNLDEAEKAFQHSGCELNRARVLVRLGKYQQAHDIYFKHENLSVSSLLNHAQALMMLQEYDQAIKLCTLKDERVLVAAACIEFRAGRNDQAKKYLEEWYGFYLLLTI
jgi:tetratricopeptide (TPR) repeat protein